MNFTRRGQKRGGKENNIKSRMHKTMINMASDFSPPLPPFEEFNSYTSFSRKMNLYIEVTRYGVDDKFYCNQSLVIRD